jgi:hypothetical protein
MFTFSRGRRLLACGHLIEPNHTMKRRQRLHAWTIRGYDSGPDWSEHANSIVRLRSNDEMVEKSQEALMLIGRVWSHV